jgi:hypothetical protein
MVAIVLLRSKQFWRENSNRVFVSMWLQYNVEQRILIYEDDFELNS